MVRFYWHVDDGCSAHVPVNGVTLADSEPTRLAVEMDVPGVAGSAVGMMSMPPCTEDGKAPPLKNVGIVIAHDVDAASWQGPLLTSIAQCLAKRGFIVMRNYCNLKELRRLRMFEKALDTVSKSPYATAAGVESWLLVGVGNGARVAATVSSKAKTNIAGLAVVSYPLHESTPPAGKGAGFPDSTSQLIKCSAPLLVLQGELDARCSTATMSAFLRQLRPQQPGPRFGIIPAVNESLLGTDDAILNARTLVCKALLEFAEGLPVETGDDFDLPGIPSVHSDACMLPAPPPQCASELGVLLDLPMRQQERSAAEPQAMPDSFPVQGSSNQLLTPRGAPGLPSAQPPIAAPVAACVQPVQPVQPVAQAQHMMGMDAHPAAFAMQPQAMLGLAPQAAMGAEAPMPFVAHLPLATGQLASLPPSLAAPAAPPALQETALGGSKPAMPLFRAEEGHMQPPPNQ